MPANLEQSLDLLRRHQIPVREHKMKAIVKKKTETFLHNNEAFAVQINNKKGERSDLIFLSEGRETILELFTVRIFVGSSQNAARGPFFFFLEFLSLFCCVVIFE